MKFSIDEQETVIRWDPVDSHWVVWTCMKPMMNRLKKLADPVSVQRDSDGEYAMTFHLPAKWVKLSRPRKVSEAQREAARERMTRRAE